MTDITYISNLPIYIDLVSEDMVFLGRKAQQKRIRKYLRLMNQPTPGNLAAWEEVYQRWKALTHHAASTTMNDEKQTEWQNYTGFLAALGVCSLTDEGRRMVDRFMAEMTDLLVSDHVFMREGVKDALGNDLAPSLYATLFRHLTSMTGRLFSNDDVVLAGLTNTLFVEQVALVLKLILDRLVDPNDSLLTIEFGTFVDQFTLYADAIHHRRVKINVCHLVETCLSKKDQIVIGNETRLRNKVLHLIKGWMTTNGDDDELQRDLDLACLKAMVQLLHRLPLQPLEPVRTTDAFQVKSRLFYGYFDFFLLLLARCVSGLILGEGRYD
jgi:neurofibromin 1